MHTTACKRHFSLGCLAHTDGCDPEAYARCVGRLSAGYPDYVSLSMCMLQDCMTAAALMVVAILSYCRSEGIMNIYVGKCH